MSNLVKKKVVGIEEYLDEKMSKNCVPDNLDPNQMIEQNYEILQNLNEKMDILLQVNNGKDKKEGFYNYDIKNSNVEGIKDEEFDKHYNMRNYNEYEVYVEMKEKLELSIPKITIIYIILFSMSFVFFTYSFILTVKRGIYIMHPFFSLTSAVGSIGLVITATASIYDWRKFLLNEIGKIRK